MILEFKNFDLKFNLSQEQQNDRSKFANSVCQLIIENSNYNLDLALKKVEIFFDFFEDNVRNIYELIDSEIFLFYLYRLTKSNYEDFDFVSQEEYNIAVSETKKVCYKFYNFPKEKIPEV